MAAMARPTSSFEVRLEEPHQKVPGNELRRRSRASLTKPTRHRSTRRGVDAGSSRHAESRCADRSHRILGIHRTEDWRYRMMTPAKGDYPSIPLNPEGRKVAEAWDPAKDEAAGNQCKA